MDKGYPALMLSDHAFARKLPAARQQVARVLGHGLALCLLGFGRDVLLRREMRRRPELTGVDLSWLDVRAESPGALMGMLLGVYSAVTRCH